MESDTQIQKGAGGVNLKSYATGFCLSIILTLAAYFLTLRHVNSDHAVFSHQFLAAAIMLLAVTQLAVQMIFFLHLGRESKPRWNLMIFGFMFVTLIIVVLGSLWIMWHLNYNMMGSRQMNAYVQQEEAIHK